LPLRLQGLDTGWLLTFTRLLFFPALSQQLLWTHRKKPCEFSAHMIRTIISCQFENLLFPAKRVTFVTSEGQGLEMTLSVRLNEKNDEFLSVVSSKMNKPKSFFINEALSEYLEDRMDYLEACEIIENSKEEDLVSLEKVKAMYELHSQRTA
jgi:RHH-type rel operon transcriptional repressor/antitoxin RelB